MAIPAISDIFRFDKLNVAPMRKLFAAFALVFGAFHGNHLVLRAGEIIRARSWLHSVPSGFKIVKVLGSRFHAACKFFGNAKDGNELSYVRSLMGVAISIKSGNCIFD
jgi:hypothetical protein